MTRTERPAPRGRIMSTRLVAERLRVSEATVKRWADEGLLACYRTPGGHRKFRPSDVTAFVSAHGFGSADAGEIRSADRDDALALALKGDAPRLFELCRRRLEGGLALERLCDEVLGQALIEVGERWACDSISVADEHVATSTVCQVLAQLAPVVTVKPTRGIAICGCTAGDRHDVASRMAALLLGSRGYGALVVGADTPPESLARLIVRHRTSVVTVSVSLSVATQPELPANLAVIAAAAREAKARLFVGGRGVTDGLVLPEGAVRVANMRALGLALPR